MPTEEDRRDPSPQDQSGKPSTDRDSGTVQDGSVPTSTEPVETHGNAGETPAPYVPADDPYGSYDDPYGYQPYGESNSEPAPVVKTEEPPPPPPPAKKEEADSEPDDDDEGMLRMSFLEHLQELRKRILLALAGLGVAFLTTLTFTKQLWLVVQQPAALALQSLGYSAKEAALVATSPMESFSIIWVKLPLMVGLFLASPWLLYQVWAFVSPGLYKRERRYAVPFVFCSAFLFILGGLFAYFIAFRFALTFLLGIGHDVGVRQMITITEYFDIFCNVILGIGVVFELPVLIFFLTLLRIASAKFLLTNARYAVLAIVALAAVITPTADVVNLMLFSVPMVVLYFVGVFASYLLTLSRENRRFPWRTFLIAVGIPAALIAAGLYLAIARFGFHFIGGWPFLVR
jgi:sec-independent protein translocase protein TatC